MSNNTPTSSANRFRFRAYHSEAGMMSHDEIDDMDKKGTLFWADLLSGKEPNFTLLQSTGLLDKKGVEIYEGDLLGYSHKDAGGSTVEHREAVFFGEFRCGFDWTEYSALGFYTETVSVTRGGVDETALWKKSYARHHGLLPLICNQPCEVIGNIYENPKLLPTPKP